MKLWRVSDYASLDGRGGELFNGRWHHAGHRVVYTAEHSALALLETLVRYEVEQTPPPYQLLEIDVADQLPAVSFTDDVAPADQDLSMAWGDAWLEALAFPLARVPSSLAPFAFNYLINPAHPDSRRIKVVRHARYAWDARLFC
ncbi:MAG: RES family NAD+ phosphorylase [Sphingomicrobium sp.]|nr:RES family NAD+ phosphorylase [Sphingomonadales bacterium]